MSYISVYDAIQKIITVGQGALLAKIDIKSAFRLLPDPADHHLLSGKGYIHRHLSPLRLAFGPKAIQCSWIRYYLTKESPSSYTTLTIS